MMQKGRFLGLGLLSVMLLLAAGCKQKEGDACQTSSDCKGSLICCFDTVTGKGTCQYECIAVDASVPDAATTDGDVTPDGAEPDADLVDAAMDAAPVDAQPIDAAVDAETVDASAPVVDATVDASP